MNHVHAHPSKRYVDYTRITRGHLVLFCSLFSHRVWQQAQVLIIGAILCTGNRTVSAILRVMGLSQEQRFDKYHRVLSRAI